MILITTVQTPTSSEVQAPCCNSVGRLSLNWQICSCPSRKLHIDCELLTAYYCNGDFEVQDDVVVIYDVSLGDASLLWWLLLQLLNLYLPMASWLQVLLETTCWVLACGSFDDSSALGDFAVEHADSDCGASFTSTSPTGETCLGPTEDLDPIEDTDFGHE